MSGAAAAADQKGRRDVATWGVVGSRTLLRRHLTGTGCVGGAFVVRSVRATFLARRQPLGGSLFRRRRRRHPEQASGPWADGGSGHGHVYGHDASCYRDGDLQASHYHPHRHH